MEDLCCYSLPVSGGMLISQSACLCELYEAKKRLCGGKFKSYKQYKPDICLGSSGGNVASFIADAGDFTSEGILRMLCTLNSDMFIKNWFPEPLNFLPTVALGVFNGSIFRPGYGPSYLFHRYFSPKTIQNVEHWIGTYNQTTNKAEYFCNRSHENALIKREFFESDLELFDVMKLRYLGDEENTLDKLAQASMASASIPYVVSPQKIDDHMYSDGGSASASPTIHLINEIYRLVKGHKYESAYTMSPDGRITEERVELKPRRLRHFYFSPYDTYSKEMIIAARLVSGPISQILHANLLQDKASAIQNLQRIYGVESSQLTHEHYVDANTDILCEVLKKLEQYDHFVCDLYPKGIGKIPLKGFTKKDIITKLRAVRKSYAIQVWYYKPPCD